MQAYAPGMGPVSFTKTEPLPSPVAFACQINQGHAYAITGPPYAGKTTLLVGLIPRIGARHTDDPPG